MANGSAGTYFSPQNPGLATVLPTGTQAQVFEQLAFLARHKDANEQRQAAAAAKKREEVMTQFKDALNKDMSVNFRPYRKDIATKGQQYISEFIDTMKRNNYKVPVEEQMALMEKQAGIEREMKAINSVENDLNNYLSKIPTDSPIDKSKFSENFSKMFIDASGNLVKPEEADIQSMIEQIENDPSSYDAKKVNEGFMSNVTEDISSFVQQGSKTRQEYEVRSKLMELDANGNPVPDPSTNLPKLRITPELVQRYKASPGGKALLEGTVNEMYNQGFEGSIGQAERAALENITRSYAYRNVPRRNIENQPTESEGGAKEQQSAFDRFEGLKRALQGDDAEIRRIEGGKTVNGTIISVKPGTNYQSFAVEFEKPVKKGTSTIMEKSTQYFDIKDKSQNDKFFSLANEALNSKSTEKKVAWENIRPFNDQFRQERQQTQKEPSPFLPQQTQTNNDPLGIL